MKSYFKTHELACKCGCGTAFVSKRALRKLNQMRELIGKRVYINSAARCPRHNARVGGAPLSQHRSTEERPSTAFDISLRNIDKQTVIWAAEKVGFRGLGVKYRSFVHVDDRNGRRARW